MKRLVVVGVIALVVMGFAGTAAAQDDSKVEIAGGWNYQSLRSDDDNTWRHFRNGWFADVALPVKGMWSIVGQVNGLYRSEIEQEGEYKQKLHSFLGGIRATSKRNPRADLFAQALVGASHLKISLGSESDSQTMLSFQAGGGWNIHVKENFGVRVGADYFHLRPGDSGPFLSEKQHGLRFAVGLVFGLP